MRPNTAKKKRPSREGRSEKKPKCSFHAVRDLFQAGENKQVNKQVNKQANKQTNKQANKQTN